MEPYTIRVYNTLTKRYEEIAVSVEVYHAFHRTNWNIKDNDESFFAHEIQFSSLIGGDEGAFENFGEFISAEDDPAQTVEKNLLVETLLDEMNHLTEDERRIVTAIYIDGLTEREYASETGIPPMTVHDRKARVLRKIKKFMDFQK